MKIITNQEYKNNFFKRGQIFLTTYLLFYFILFIPLWKLTFLSSIVFKFGSTFLNFPNTQNLANGSGDTYFMYSYVLLLAILISIILTIIQIIFPKKNFSKTIVIFQTLLRYWLIFMLFSYGISKIFIMQFPSNDYSRLEEKIGDMTPMGLVWTFMGASSPYTFISGLLESIAALLLLFRKTYSLGSILTIIVMGNIVLLNFFYDVPVKINSTFYLLIAILLFRQNIRPIYNFLILQKSASLQLQYIQPTKKWEKVVHIIFKTAIIVFFIFALISDFNMRNKSQLATGERVYYIQKSYNSHTNQDDTLKNFRKLSKIILNKGDYISIYLNDTTSGYRTAHYNPHDSTIQIKFQKKDLYINSNSHAIIGVNFSIKKKDSIYIFSSKIGNDSLYLEARKRTKKDYRLTNTGFHWINEYPNNQ